MKSMAHSLQNILQFKILFMLQEILISLHIGTLDEKIS